MRIWLSVVLAIILGVATGWALAGYRIARLPYTGNLAAIDAPMRVAPTTKEGDSVGISKVAVDNETYEFGSMDSHATQEHDFVFTNTGTGSLKLSKGAMSCKCTVPRFENAEVPPGGHTTVTVQWKAKDMMGPFSQQVTINTNDPDRPHVELAIKGRVVPVASINPKEGVVLSRLAADEPGLATVRLYGYKAAEKPQIKGFELRDDPTRKFFDVTFRPLTADEVKGEQDAQTGYEIKIAVKPGLPVGPFEQTISVKTGLESVPTVEIPVKGSIVSDISISGPGYSAETGAVYLGTINGAQGAERTVQVFVRGPYAKEVKFEPEEIYPSHLLRVKVGPTKVVGDGAVSVTPLTIEVPKGSPPANHFGSDQGKMGRITLKTHHPRSPELRILVRFIVEG